MTYESFNYVVKFINLTRFILEYITECITGSPAGLSRVDGIRRSSAET